MLKIQLVPLGKMISLWEIPKCSNRGGICLLELKCCAEETAVNSIPQNESMNREMQNPASRSPIKNEFSGHFSPVLLHTQGEPR